MMITTRIFHLGVSLLLSLTFAHARAPESKENLELFLLVGQSNMAGRGVLEDADRTPVKRVLVLDKDDRWVNKGEPIHFDKPKIAGVGLGFTFAKLVAKDNPEVTVGLIPCAVGGSSIYNWRPGERHFEEAVRRAKIAQELGQIKAILWHQGEAHVGDKRLAENYAQYLTTVMDGFRKELDLPNVPIIVGELGGFISERVGRDGKTRIMYVDVINEQIREFSEKFPPAASVSSEGLGHNGDFLHFNASSLKSFGERYFKAYQALTDRDSK